MLYSVAWVEEQKKVHFPRIDNWLTEFNEIYSCLGFVCLVDWFAFETGSWNIT